jgi:hypothetical protein
MKRSVLAAVVLLAGCQYDPFAHEFTSRRPTEESVIGRYVPDDDSKARLRTRFNIEVSPRCEFVLKRDQTFVAQSLPDCWFHTFDCLAGSDRWEGSWTLQQHQDWWAVALQITSRNGVPTSYHMPVMLRGGPRPYLLHLTIGDPDSGDALAFQAEPPQSR